MISTKQSFAYAKTCTESNSSSRLTIICYRTFANQSIHIKYYKTEGLTDWVTIWAFIAMKTISICICAFIDFNSIGFWGDNFCSSEINLIRRSFQMDTFNIIWITKLICSCYLAVVLYFVLFDFDFAFYFYFFFFSNFILIWLI